MNTRLSIRRRLCVAALGLIAVSASGQIGPRFDVTCSLPIENDGGAPLEGSNPAARKFNLAVLSGALVQIIDAGPNGRADLPRADGNPAGDDAVFATTVIGQGIAPNIANSGRFSTSFYPPPAQGSKVYIRAFNAPTVKAATRWGQSNIHTVEGCQVMDASVLGLWATTQPKGGDPAGTDTDGDGHSDYEELVANTNAGDERDVLEARLFDGGRVEIDGRAGRNYLLMRSLDDLGGPMRWDLVGATGLLAYNQIVALADPNPPAAQRAFYRVEVVSP